MARNSITLQNIIETDVQDNDILGQLCFAAPNEADGTAAVAIVASIFARSEEQFGSGANATELVFVTSDAESSTPTGSNGDMTLSSAGLLTVAGGITSTAASNTLGTVDINGGTIDGATIATSDITVGSSKTLNVSGGTLTTSAAQNLAIVQGAASNIDIGNYALTAQTLVADIVNGTAPLTITSTTKVTNLNADKLDDQEGSYYLDFSNFVVDADEISGDKIHGGTISGNVALEDGATATTQSSSDNSTKIATTAYVDAASGGGSSDLDATTDSGTIDIDLDSETLTVAGGTGIDTSATGTTITVAVDVSDFMATGANNRVLTAVDADSFQGESNLTFGGGDLLVGGSTPSITIGDAGSEDVKLVFDHSDADYYLGVDHVAGGGDDIFKIGIGSALGTTPVINITPAGAVSVGVDDTGYDVKLFGATAGRYWQWDEDKDGVRLRGNFVQEQVPALNSGTTVTTGTNGNTIDIDWAAGNYHWIKLGASDISKIIFRNMKRGGRYILRIQQGATARTIAESAWTGGVNEDDDDFTELRWVGGDPPTMSTGTSSTDVYGFLGTRSNGLGCDGFIIAQDLQDSIT